MTIHNQMLAENSEASSSRLPEFKELPWHLPLNTWDDSVANLVEVHAGITRHTVRFINYEGSLYVLKEMPSRLAKIEYGLLRVIDDLHLPAVTPVAYREHEAGDSLSGVLITRYLEQSVPYRVLFMQPRMKLYRQHLLDAIAGLLVQLHLAGIYWGDCSLSNTLFRGDAGALRAYLVDAETSEFHPGGLTPALRFHDLQIMEENVNGELYDLKSEGQLASEDPGIPIAEIGAYIRLRYQGLWDEITREVVINPGETYRIHERIKALNDLGFSVRDVTLEETESGDQLRLRAIVADRNFHHDQLQNLTGLDAEEMQARKMMNEIQELKATLSRETNRSTPLSVAAYHWLEKIYSPAVKQLKPYAEGDLSLAELYCQILEHKWYLSEIAHQDVGHQTATEDYIRRFGSNSP